jgi:hypothetical protein
VTDDIYLTKAELARLTGSPQKRLQIEWLEAGQWPHSIARTGHPRVLRAYHDERMSGKKPVASTNEPNYGVFRDRATQAA